MEKAYNIIAPQNNIGLFIIGDHASNHIPPIYNNLGLSGLDLRRHIAWDIGTATIIRELCTSFGCEAQIAAVSRLVIDMNREPKRDSLIPLESDGTKIPGNHNLSDKARSLRVNRYYRPYHSALSQRLDAIEASAPLILSIHSFTPQIHAQPPRTVDIGLLMRHDETTVIQFQSSMQAAYDYDVRLNEPYSAYDLNFTIDHHLAPRGLRHLAIEIRQDHINTDDKAHFMAKRLTHIIKPLI